MDIWINPTLWPGYFQQSSKILVYIEFQDPWKLANLVGSRSGYLQNSLSAIFSFWLVKKRRKFYKKALRECHLYIKGTQGIRKKKETAYLQVSHEALQCLWIGQEKAKQYLSHNLTKKKPLKPIQRNHYTSKNLHFVPPKRYTQYTRGSRTIILFPILALSNIQAATAQQRGTPRPTVNDERLDIYHIWYIALTPLGRG